MQTDLAFAVDLAERAGSVLMASFGKVQRIDRKSARDVVTDVDFTSEALIIDAIRERFPDDAILAEESGAHAGAREGRDGANGRVWLIDPLDGTVNYANGIPFFCVSIGLVTDGRPSAGVVLDPARGDRYTATADGPAELNGLPVRASDKDAIADFVISLTVIGRGGATRERAIGREIRIPRRMGSAALALAYVGSGRFDAFVQSGGLSLWDVAAAGLVAERGGATVSDIKGGPWFDLRRAGRRTSIVAAPPAHHARMVELVGPRKRAVTRAEPAPPR
ncbi:MAG: inositol monophosphatase [Candidatus Limnocylindria bacterium]